MAFVVLYDANVTDQILGEAFRNLSADRPGLDPRKLARTRSLMNNAVRGCLVTGYEPLIDVLDLPDVDDRHVLAAAIRVRAQVCEEPRSALQMCNASTQALP